MVCLDLLLGSIRSQSFSEMAEGLLNGPGVMSEAELKPPAVGGCDFLTGRDHSDVIH